MQAFGNSGISVGEATLVAQPDLIDFFVLARHNAFDHCFTVAFGFAAHIVSEVAPHGALRADGWLVNQFPGTGAKMEISGGESTNGADIGGVAGEDGIKTGFGEGINLQVAPALIKTDHGIINHLVLEAHTTRTLDAAFAVEDR